MSEAKGKLPRGYIVEEIFFPGAPTGTTPVRKIYHEAITVAEHEALLAAEKAENARLRAALEFYAKELKHPLGNKAREALSQVPHKGRNEGGYKL